MHGRRDTRQGGRRRPRAVDVMHGLLAPVMVRPTTRPAPAPIVEAVGSIAVPAHVREHRFCLEALAIATHHSMKDDEDLEKVIGTANTGRTELYGWGANVAQHVDNTGFMYLLPLHVDRSVLYAQHGDDFREQVLQVGQVVRLWDFAKHWTEDRAGAVAAFVGSFDGPDDARALCELQAGVDALARGDYHGAPRVREGFRIPARDECLVTTDFESAQLTLHADAIERGVFVIPCSSCNRPAQHLDSAWPHHWENCLCTTCKMNGH